MTPLYFFAILTCAVVFVVYTVAVAMRCKGRKETFIEGKIPSFQIYHDPSRIPDKVARAWQRHAGNFNRRVYTYEQAREFLAGHFRPEVARKFDEIKNLAHKADLFRLCVLYVYGGLYTDAKTELVADLSETFADPSKMYLCLSEFVPDTVYNGVIYSPPRNPVLKHFITDIMNRSASDMESFYHVNIHSMHDILREYYTLDKKLTVGPNKTVEGVPDLVLLLEKNMDSSACADGLDRYGLCSYVVDHAGKVVLKTRYADYPW